MWFSGANNIKIILEGGLILKNVDFFSQLEIFIENSSKKSSYFRYSFYIILASLVFLCGHAVGQVFGETIANIINYMNS